MNANEKLNLLREQLEPTLREQLKAAGPAASMAAAFIVPQVEGYVDRHLARPTDELDAELANAIDYLGRLRSDDASPLITGAGGAFTLVVTDRRPVSDEYPGGLLELVGIVGAPVRASGVPDGSDPDREVDAGAGALPLSSGPAASDRPGG